jgi:ferredoxin
MTKATVYYFSATGNSYTLARALAARTGAALVPMTRVRAGETRAAERVALVFPTYAWGLPRTVEELVARLELPPGAHVMGVTSCAGIPAGTLHALDRALRRRGHRLQAGFAVRDPSSSLISRPDDWMQRVMIRLCGGRFPRPSRARLDELADHLRTGAAHRLEGSGWLANQVGRLFHRLSGIAFPTLDQHFWTTDACTGCGTCVQLCPRKNIQLVDGKPRFGGDCDVCHACIQWCARSALQFKDLTAARPRYRNPEVKVKELMGA